MAQAAGLRVESAKDVSVLAELGYQDAQGVLKEAGRLLGLALSYAACLVDVDGILIGGGVSAQQKLLIDPIAAKVKAAVMPAFAEGLEIRAAQLHNDAGMVGAVYYFRQTMEKE